VSSFLKNFFFPFLNSKLFLSPSLALRKLSDVLKLFLLFDKKLINVFVPTTPNPTSGFLLMFPKEDVIYLDLTFEEASKFIVSAGTSNPK